MPKTKVDREYYEDNLELVIPARGLPYVQEVKPVKRKKKKRKKRTYGY